MPSVSFTGGEPTLRKDLVELVAAAKRIGLRTNLITNGTLIDANLAGRLREAGLASAQVSLEGPIALGARRPDRRSRLVRAHDGRAGRPCAGQASTLTPTRRSTPSTPIHLEALVELLAGLGLERMSANMVIPSGSAADLAHADHLQPDRPDRHQVRDCARDHGIEFHVVLAHADVPVQPVGRRPGQQELRRLRRTAERLARRATCCRAQATRSRWAICAGRDSRRCGTAARAVFFRNKQHAPTDCAGCEEFLACAGACPLYWSAMGTGELVQVRRDHVFA